MATYKGINGFAVQSVASDPTFDEGQVWYNNTSYAFKLATLTTTGTFASGGNVNTDRTGSGAGTQTAALMGPGEGPAAPAFQATETYNGTSWTTSPATYPTQTVEAGQSGTQTASICFGGRVSPYLGPNAAPTANSNTFNGSSWTSAPTLTYGRNQGMAAGVSQTAALFVGGGGPAIPPSNYNAEAQSYNGSSWSAASSLGSARGFSQGAGPNTAAIVIGGSSNPYPTQTSAVETWNGTSWTSSTSLPISKQGLYVTQQSPNSNVLATGGPDNTNSYLWNGSSWSTSASIPAGRSSFNGGVGTVSAGLILSAYGTPSTLEYTGPGAPTTKTITTS